VLRGAYKSIELFQVDDHLHPAIRVAYAGSNAVVLETAFAGTLLAPNASLRLGTPSAPARYVGSFYAKDLEVSPDSVVELRPFFTYTATKSWGGLVTYGAWRDAQPLADGTVLGVTEKALYRINATGTPTAVYTSPSATRFFVNTSGRFALYTDSGVSHHTAAGALLGGYALPQPALVRFAPGTDQLVLLQASHVSHDSMLDSMRVVSGGSTGTVTTNVTGLDVALLGPFKWTPSAADLDGAASGHRCFLAAIDVSDDAGPPLASVASWDVRKLDNVAQRNVQVSELSFAIQNPQPNNLGSRLLIDVGTFPVGSAGASLVIKLGQTAELDALLTYPKQDGAYQIALTTGMLTLPPSGSWVMPAVSEVPATVDYSLPVGSGPHTVKISHELDGKIVGGMVFILSGPDIVK
jgi:hypothetical protein